jgi:hypothetical protein
MKIPTLIIIPFLILVLSCNKKEEEVVFPDYVLSHEKYVQLMLDFSLAESANNLNPKGLSGRKFDSAYAFNPLVDNKVSQQIYDSTVAFYSRHPQLYKKIHEDVLTALSKMLADREKAENERAAKREKAKNDSLIAVKLKNDSLEKIKPKKKKKITPR